MTKIKNENIDINQMTPKVWNAMSLIEQYEWRMFWNRKGILSFCCLSCGFPTSFGQSSCEACKPEEIEDKEYKYNPFYEEKQ
jgi:hypothetical protein